MRDVTILFLQRTNETSGTDEVLLAMKKRGFGEGKWNGTGGKVEPDETIEQAAVRECQEEIGVTPQYIRAIGVLAFRQSHNQDFGHRAHIFTTDQWEGTPIETEEMRPEWFDVASIPYDQMWADDPLWLPLALEGKPFSGEVTLGPDGQIISSSIVLHSPDGDATAIVQ